MKKLLTLIAAALLLAACSDIMEAPVHEGKGTVQVKMSASQDGAGRTLRPSSIIDPGALYYTLVFTSDERDPVSKNSAGGTPIEVELISGLWNLEVKGFVSEAEADNPANALFSGVKTGINVEPGESTVVSVDLSLNEANLTQTGTGTLSYEVTLPEDAVAGTLEVYTLTDTPVGSEIQLTAALTTGEITLNSGFYYVVVKVTKTDGTKATWREVAQIYDNAVTVAAPDLNDSIYYTPVDAAITGFDFPSMTGEEVEIDEDLKTITVNVKNGVNFSSLSPAIAFSGVMVEPAGPVNFSNSESIPVEYRVYAENGTAVTYSVKVTNFFDSQYALSTWLGNLPANNAESPYKIRAVVSINIYIDFLNVFKSSGRYIALDLTGSTIPYIARDFFKGCTSLTSVTIPDSVKTIGEYAFYGCTSLESVTIPDSVKTIGEYAFDSCSSLTSVIIGEGVTSIGARAFARCTGLTSVTIPAGVATIRPGVFISCSSLQTIEVDTGNENYKAEDGVLYTKNGELLIQYPGGKTETSVTIPGSVKTIGEYAFTGCTGLTSVTISAGVTSIDNYAFVGCTGLTSVTIPGSVTSIGDGAFVGCTGLTSVTIPGSVTSIGDSAFSYCDGLTSVTISAGVTSIGTGAFTGCTGLTSVTIPGSVTYIRSYAFDDCTGLTSVTIPGSVTSIGDSAFRGCTGLTSVTFERSGTSSISGTFPGNLHSVYRTGGAGTYTRPSGTSIYWSKQP